MYKPRSLRGALSSILVMAALAFAVPAAVAAPPPCLPATAFGLPLGGTGSPLVVGGSDLGDWWVVKCPDGKVYGKVMLKGYTGGPTFSSLVIEAKSYPSFGAAVAGLWDKYDNASTEAPYMLLAKQAQDAGKAAVLPTPVVVVDPPPPAPVVPAVVWRVAKNGTTADRPTYPWDGKTRGTKTNGRALVGVVCDCSAGKASVEGSVSYCTTAPASVAICVPVTP